MTSILYLAWRYLLFHKVKSLILLVSITVIFYLPVGLKVVVDQSAESLTARADATPLVIGAQGSPLELVLNTLYFESRPPSAIRYGEVGRIEGYGLARAIPMHTRFRSDRYPIVGTRLDYFEFRGLEIASGRNLAMLGECVLGCEVARRSDLNPGDQVVSSPETVFDLAGVYPLKMRIVGVFKPTETADDFAIFVDLKTAWVIEGLAHGHQDMSGPEAASGVLARQDDVIVANASVVQYNQITPDNLESFHFHGDPGLFPISAVIAVPYDRKSATLLQGKYLGQDEGMQIVNPVPVITELLQTILTVQSYVVTAVVVVGLCTLATAVLVFLLSLQLRRREIETLHKIGAARSRVWAILVSEMIGVMLVALILAASLTALTSYFGAELIRVFVL